MTRFARVAIWIGVALALVAAAGAMWMARREVANLVTSPLASRRPTSG